MSRRRSAVKRTVRPDVKYQSPLFEKFISTLMWEGKKSVARKIFYKAVERTGASDPVEFVQLALGNVKPSVEVKSKRVGGATYPVPKPVSLMRAQTLALRWLIEAARKRPEKTMVERLSEELKNAAAETGAAVKKRIDTHRMAAANQAFAHYQW